MRRGACFSTITLPVLLLSGCGDDDTPRTASGVDLSGETYVETYTGSARIGPSDAASIVELVRTGDFDAVLTWNAGLDAEAPFAVGTLQDPPRLVIDVRAG